MSNFAIDKLMYFSHVSKALRFIADKSPFSKKDRNLFLTHEASRLLSENNFIGAELQYQEALRIYKWSLDPYIGLSICLIAREDIISAERILNQGLKYCGSHEAIFNLKTRCLINSRSTNKALKSWLSWRSIQNKSSTHDYYSMAAEILVSSLKIMGNENTNHLIIEDLIYQSDTSLTERHHPSLCYILFHYHEHDRKLFSTILMAVNEYIDLNGINYNKATLCTYTLVLSFNMVNDDERRKILEDNLFRFSVSSHLPFVLMGTANCSIWHDALKANKKSIHIVQGILKNIECHNFNNEGIFNFILISDVCKSITKYRVLSEIYNSQITIDDSKYGEALSFIKNGISGTPVSINAEKKRLRIAVCVSGQMRGWRRSFSSWDKIGLNNHDVTYFVHTWKAEGGSSPVPPNNTRHLPTNLIGAFSDAWNILGEGKMRQRYKNFFSLWGSSSGEINARDIADVYASAECHIDDDTCEPFNTMNNPQKMYYKIYKCNDMAMKSESEFDLVVRIRPDIEFTQSINIDWLDIYHKASTQRIIYAETSNSDSPTYMFPNIGYAMSDYFAVSTPSNMISYSQAYPMGLGDKINGNNVPDVFPSGFEAHRNVAYSTLFNSVSIEGISLPHRFIPAFSPSVDAIYNALTMDCINRNDEIDKMLLQALR
ncbi:TPA: tetratricopeptide repeat protein [Yersinia enterocolitica]|nr:tetratricopeptide repeat protein [Yersinia enterocolitica]